MVVGELSAVHFYRTWTWVQFRTHLNIRILRTSEHLSQPPKFARRSSQLVQVYGRRPIVCGSIFTQAGRTWTWVQLNQFRRRLDIRIPPNIEHPSQQPKFAQRSSQLVDVKITQNLGVKYPNSESRSHVILFRGFFLSPSLASTTPQYCLNVLRSADQ